MKSPLSTQLRRWLTQLRRLLRGRGYHVLFGASIVALAALIAWWSVFIYSAINQQQASQYASLKSSAVTRALMLGHDSKTKPALGPLAGDERLEIELYQHGSTQPLAFLAPYWPDLCIVPRASYVRQIEEKHRRQTLMVFGESGFLLLIILICSSSLYRIVWLERRSSRELHEFWGRMTHELKSPITGIKAFLQTLQKREFQRDELLPLLRLALREVERQEMLAENLLIGQRMERRGGGLQIRACGLVQHVKEFLKEHRVIIPEESLRLEIACAEDLLALADPDALRVILENLIDNALKYGGEAPKIVCKISTAANGCAVAVSDQGMGFAPQHAEQIFEAYCRLTEDLPEGRHGTGMGLYIARRLARRMGGELRAASAGRGQGACFTLTLRRAQGAQE